MNMVFRLCKYVGVEFMQVLLDSAKVHNSHILMCLTKKKLKKINKKKEKKNPPKRCYMYKKSKRKSQQL